MIAEDDDTVGDRRRAHAARRRRRRSPRARPRPARAHADARLEHRARRAITELDEYVAPGSALDVIVAASEVRPRSSDLSAELANLTIAPTVADTTNRATLEALDVAELRPRRSCWPTRAATPQRADTRTLVTLLHLREIAERARAPLLDRQRDARRAQPRAGRGHQRRRLHRQRPAGQPDARAGLGEQAPGPPCFDDLFDADGLRDLPEAGGRLRRARPPVNFYTVVEAARRRGEIAIGYRTAADGADAARGYGVVVNPDKSATASYEPADRVIVLAET